MQSFDHIKRSPGVLFHNWITLSAAKENQEMHQKHDQNDRQNKAKAFIMPLWCQKMMNVSILFYWMKNVILWIDILHEIFFPNVAKEKS